MTAPHKRTLLTELQEEELAAEEFVRFLLPNVDEPLISPAMRDQSNSFDGRPSWSIDTTGKARPGEEALPAVEDIRPDQKPKLESLLGSTSGRHLAWGAKDPKTADNLPWHGSLGAHEKWHLPVCVTQSDLTARPGKVSMDASEYVDVPFVLEKKVSLLARMINGSKHLVAFSGAGLGTSAGIGDYASRAKGSVSGQSGLGFTSRMTTKSTSDRDSHRRKKKGPRKAMLDANAASKDSGPSVSYLREAKPATGHRVLAGLAHCGALKDWITQTYDGLAHKSTCPPSMVTEIHGSWFDTRNPPIKPKGKPRADLEARVKAIAGTADVVLALGTSLSGTCSDTVALQCAERAKSLAQAAEKRGEVEIVDKGLVIISLQRTIHDTDASLRIYGHLDEVLELLSKKLGIRLPSDEEIELRRKKPIKWYADLYDENDRSWTRETKLQRLQRAHPGHPDIRRLRFEADRRLAARESAEETKRQLSQTLAETNKDVLKGNMSILHVGFGEPQFEEPEQLDVTNFPDTIPVEPKFRRNLDFARGSKYRGVRRAKNMVPPSKRWNAQIYSRSPKETVNHFSLGSFPTEEEAALAYAKAYYQLNGPGNKSTLESPHFAHGSFASSLSRMTM